MPPGHWLLVHDDGPFRARLTGAGEFPENAVAIPVADGFVAAFPPRSLAAASDASLALERHVAGTEDAVATLQRYAHEPSARLQRDFEETIDWVDSKDTVWPYSFENVCSALSFEPESVRRRLSEWRERRVSNGKVDSYRFPFRRVNGKRHAITIRDRSKARKRA